MTKHTFATEPRTVVGRKVKTLRSKGLVPASIYGKSSSSLNIQLPAKAFTKLRQQIGESALIYLTVTGSTDEHPVIVREVVSHPVTSQLLHVSFNEVSLKEKVTAPVAIKLEGEAPAETEKLGIMVQQLDEVELEALPTDIPEALIVDVSILTSVDQAITVADLKVDTSKLTIKTEPESVIVKIEPLAAEEVEEAPAAATEGEAGETPAAEGESASEPAKEEKSE